LVVGLFVIPRSQFFMSYQVIARKYRPQIFDDVVGQRLITDTLKNAIQTDRVAHGYIFSGARGVGKTSTARILAKSLNCVEGPTVTPCGKCPSCQEIAAGNSVDVFEIDAASNRGIDEIRELRETVRYLPGPTWQAYTVTYRYPCSLLCQQVYLFDHKEGVVSSRIPCHKKVCTQAGTAVQVQICIEDVGCVG